MSAEVEARLLELRRLRPYWDEIRDEQLVADLRTVHKDNFSVCGVKKMHAAMTRRGWHLGREQTRRLMHKAGLRGVQRGKPAFTTVTNPADARPADLVNRQFTAPAPNRLWVADITYVRTWQGFCYAAFVTDVGTRTIVGWAVSATMRTEDLPLQAFNHAVWQSHSDLSELVHHSDRGSQGGFNWSSQHLDRGGGAQWRRRIGPGRPGMCPRGRALPPVTQSQRRFACRFRRCEGEAHTADRSHPTTRHARHQYEPSGPECAATLRVRTCPGRDGPERRLVASYDPSSDRMTTIFGAVA